MQRVLFVPFLEKKKPLEKTEENNREVSQKERRGVCSGRSQKERSDNRRQLGVQSL